MRNLSIKHDVTEKWNFCRLSSAFCAVEWKYFYLRRIVGNILLFLSDLVKDSKKRTNAELIFAVCRKRRA